MDTKFLVVLLPSLFSFALRCVSFRFLLSHEQESLQQGVSDVAELTRKSGAVNMATSGIKLAADHTIKMAEMSLEKAGSTAKVVLDMADAVTGVDTASGGKGRGGTLAGSDSQAQAEEEMLTFGHAFFIYGGNFTNTNTR